MRLYDTMTGAVRDFVPVRAGQVSIYLCGATVQGLPHIGHVRSGVAFDVLRRWLMAKGFDVAFIRNVTDIDDKILNKAADAGRPWWEWAATYERAFSAAYDALGVLPPSAEPRATGHITQIIELIERLIERKHAYTGDGDVYFNVQSLLPEPGYGKLSGHKIDDVHQGEGVATGKRDQRDFTLWKGEKPGEPSWPTPWGRGRPGWHTECVAMCEAYLGAEFDIHAGGMDLIFPHHENEIAQAEAVGDKFARFWLHNGWVTMGGEKMSKSLGNVLAIPAVLQRVRPAELRYYLGSAHYRSMLEFTETALQDAAKAYTGIEDFLHRVRNRVGAVEPGDWTTRVRGRARRRPVGPDRARRGACRTRRGQQGARGGRPRHGDGPRLIDPDDDGHPRLRPARRAVGVPRRNIGGAGSGRCVGTRRDSASSRGTRAQGLGRGRRDPGPVEERGRRGHRYRRRSAVDTAGRILHVNGWQLPTSGCGPQGRHQERPQGRVGRRPPPWSGGPRRYSARSHAAQPSGRQTRREVAATAASAETR